MAAAAVDTSVFARNGLRVAIGTKEVDPAMLDWSRIDIRSLNIYQPPGPDNVLGTVKFLFPNKHDVYMHDTTQKNSSRRPCAPRAMAVCGCRIRSSLPRFA